MKSGPRICITIVVASGLLLECSTVRAQEKVQHRTQTFSVQELFRDQDDAARLNQSSATRSRSDVQGDADSGITTIGTLPAWIFPSFSQAALEPSFGEHFDITGVKVPEARLQCIPDLDSEEYRRLIEVRNQMWETIIRAFPEIDDWLVGPEPSYSVFVDCKGVPLSVDDLVRFFVDTLEELHLVITAENSEAQMIAHFLGDPWIPIVIRGERVQPSDIRSRMQTEIESRNGLAADYYDQLAEELDSSLVADRFPERIPPVTASSESDSSDESSSQTRSSDTCIGTQVDGWNEKFEEPFDTDVDDLVTDTRYSWSPWRTDTGRVHLPVIRGERVQPSDIRSRMQTEIESRNGLAADYYDQLAEELDSRSLVADRFPERIPPVTASSESDSSDESSSQTRSSDTCIGTQVDGWNEKFEEPFDTDVDDLVTDTRYSWSPWRTDTGRVHLPVVDGLLVRFTLVLVVILLLSLGSKTSSR